MSRESGKVTIRDISAKLGVSSVSVHRALTGKEGISDELRKTILETASEMGYEMNYIASSLKRKPTRIAVVLPDDDDRYFALFWKGMRACARDLQALNIEIVEYVSRDEQHQLQILSDIARRSDEFRGLLTFTYTRQLSYLLLLQKFVARGMAVAVLDDSIDDVEGVYYIPAHAGTLGAVAAEFVGLISPAEGTVLLTGGRRDSALHHKKADSFISHLIEHRPHLKTEIVGEYHTDGSGQKQLVEAMKKALFEHPDTVAFYALTSHDNDAIVEAVQEMHMQDQVRIVATDLNRHTAAHLSAGEVSAIINQGAFLKGYHGLDVLVDRLIRNTDAEKSFDCPIDLVLRSNLDFYAKANYVYTD